MAQCDHRKNRISSIFIVALIILIPSVIFILSGSREVHYSGVANEDSTSKGLYCKGNNLDNTFFSTYAALNITHEIKVLFNKDVVDKINYTYTGEYESEKQATDTFALLHADYNIYMSKNSIDQEALLPTFSIIDSKGIINLSVDEATLTRETAKIIFLSNEQYYNLLEYSIEDIENIYKNIGFYCELID